MELGRFLTYFTNLITLDVNACMLSRCFFISLKVCPPLSHLACVCVSESAWRSRVMCPDVSYGGLSHSSATALTALPTPPKLWLYFSATRSHRSVTQRTSTRRRKELEGAWFWLLRMNDNNVILYWSLLENSLSACPLPQQLPWSWSGSSVLLKGTSAGQVLADDDLDWKAVKRERKRWEDVSGVSNVCRNSRLKCKERIPVSEVFLSSFKGASCVCVRGRKGEGEENRSRKESRG